MENKKFNDIWKIDNQNEFIIAMDNWICEKCSYGENIEKLSAAEKTFHLNQEFERYVNNGGFISFFDHSDFIYDTINSLNEIRAYKTAEIYKKAIDSFDFEIPVDRMKREDILINLSDDIIDTLDEYSKEFFKYDNNLNDLNY